MLGNGIPTWKRSKSINSLLLWCFQQSQSVNFFLFVPHRNHGSSVVVGEIQSFTYFTSANGQKQGTNIPGFTFCDIKMIIMSTLKWSPQPVDFGECIDLLSLRSQFKSTYPLPQHLIVNLYHSSKTSWNHRKFSMVSSQQELRVNRERIFFEGYTCFFRHFYSAVEVIHCIIKI